MFDVATNVSEQSLFVKRYRTKLVFVWAATLAYFLGTRSTNGPSLVVERSGIKEGLMFSRVRSLAYRFNLILASLQLSDSLPFSGVLSQEQIQSFCDRHNVSFDQDVYTPAITLWGFLSQVIHKGENRSCLAAVLRIGKMLLTVGRTCCTDNSGAYCRARDGQIGAYRR